MYIIEFYIQVFSPPHSKCDNCQRSKRSVGGADADTVHRHQSGRLTSHHRRRNIPAIYRLVNSNELNRQLN